jgi:hypothetical protein
MNVTPNLDANQTRELTATLHHLKKQRPNRLIDQYILVHQSNRHLKTDREKYGVRTRGTAKAIKKL